MSTLPLSAQRVADAAAALGLTIDIVTFNHSTRTAEEAAAAIGCAVGQIVKSLVFTVGERPVIALVSGTNQLDTRNWLRYMAWGANRWPAPTPTPCGQ